MKRFWRQAFNVLAGVSLLLCIAVSALCIRSYWINEGYGWIDAARDHCGILSGRGSLVFARTNMADHPDGWEREDDPNHSGGVMAVDTYRQPWATEGNVSGSGWRFAGIAVGHYYSGSLPVEDQFLVMPDWLLIVLFAVLPAWLLLGPRSLRWHGSGNCARCGYDLRATPDRCPECGTMPDKPPKMSG